MKRAFEEFATGRHTKQEVLALVTDMGLRTRRGMVLSPQSFALILKNPLYMGTVASPESGISGRGKFDPLINEATFTACSRF